MPILGDARCPKTRRIFAPDVIVAHGASTVAPLQQVTRTVPIVFPVAGDPVSRTLNLDVRVLEIPSPDQFEPVLTAAARDGLHALCISHSPLFNENRQQVTALVNRLRLPAVYGFREFATAGGLLSYSSNLSDVWRRAAGVVDKILKGEKPGDLPIERPGRELLVNLKTAKSLGLAVPERFLLIADEVIE